MNQLKSIKTNKKFKQIVVHKINIQKFIVFWDFL